MFYFGTYLHVLCLLLIRIITLVIEPTASRLISGNHFWKSVRDIRGIAQSVDLGAGKRRGNPSDFVENAHKSIALIPISCGVVAL